MTSAKPLDGDLFFRIWEAAAAFQDTVPVGSTPREVLRALGRPVHHRRLSRREREFVYPVAAPAPLWFSLHFRDERLVWERPLAEPPARENGRRLSA